MNCRVEEIIAYLLERASVNRDAGRIAMAQTEERFAAFLSESIGLKEEMREEAKA
jgi:hypothetical protein